MRTYKIKLIAIIFFILPLVGFGVLRMAPTKVAAGKADDPASLYKKYACIGCHTPKATKFFDPAKAEADLAHVILKGKKSEKLPNPPNMPAYETKPMTEDEAKEMVKYMISIRPPAN